MELTMDPYLQKTEALLREGKGRLDRLSVAMRASAPEFSALARRRKLVKCEARYSELNRHFELLRSAGTEGLGHLKMRLEKACEAFRIEMGGAKVLQGGDRGSSIVNVAP